MAYNRGLLPAALVMSLGAAGWAVVHSRDADQTERLGQTAFARQLGDVRVRQGITLHQRGEYAAAVAAWERYIASAPPNADTVSIREMIAEAQKGRPQEASAGGPVKQGPRSPRRVSVVACGQSFKNIV